MVTLDLCSLGVLRTVDSWHSRFTSLCFFPVFSPQILDEIAEQGIRIYQLPDADSDEDEEFKEQTRVLKVRLWGDTISSGFYRCFHLVFFSLYWHLFHWCLRDCRRRVFPSLWLAPTSWSRWRGRRSVVVFTPGVLLRWRTPNTTTSSNYAPCLCEFDSKTPDNHSGIFLKIFTKPPFLLMETDCKTPAAGTDLCCRLVCV